MRERMLRAGGEGFADYELLEYLLTIAFRQGDTKPLAKALIREFGTLAAVLAATPDALQRVAGMGPAAAAALKFIEAAALRAQRVALDRQDVTLGGWEPLLAYLHSGHAHRINEQVRVLYLNAKNILLHDEVLSEGTINEAIVHPREIVRRAIEIGAAGLILVHNHPSGDPSPSDADRRVTLRMAEAAKMLQVNFFDHVILGSPSDGRAPYFSFREAGVI